MDPVLFLHIQKTAGTSLNRSVEKNFGPDFIERDYGVDAPHTTDLVRRYIYDSPTINQFGLLEETRAKNTRWITGHAPADRYIHLYGAPNTVSFVRDPVERILSEFRYLKRAGKMDRSLGDFYQTAAETNKQFSVLGHVPWRACHLVGSLEAYDQCVSLLAQELDFALEILHENKNTAVTEDDEIDNETRAAIRQHNALDCRFVSQVRAYLDARLTAFEAGKPFCHHEIAFEPDKHIIGWAFARNSDSPVSVELWVNGKLQATAQASEHRPELQAVGAPRLGHNGFRFVLDAHKSAQHIELIAADTGQSLFSWQRQSSDNHN